MAKKAEITESHIPSASEYLKFRKKMDGAKSEMDEAKGRMGATKDQEIAERNLHSDADRVASKYANKSPEQQADFRKHFLMYWGYLGLAEADMFDVKPAAPEPEPKKRGRGRPRKTEAEAIEGPGDGRSRDELEVIH